MHNIGVYARNGVCNLSTQKIEKLINRVMLLRINRLGLAKTSYEQGKGKVFAPFPLPICYNGVTFFSVNVSDSAGAVNRARDKGNNPEKEKTMDRTMNREDFTRWLDNLIDANHDTLLPWFDKVKPDFNTAWDYLHASWSHEELAHAYMKQ